MQFRRTPQFREDYNGLEEPDKRHVDRAFPDVIRALLGNAELYNHFRIKKMQGWEGIWEGHVRGDNLCFTFQKDTNGEEEICFFRRVGNHAIYKKP